VTIAPALMRVSNRSTPDGVDGGRFGKIISVLTPATQI
jgi:hypothetical protein